ncbi:MAG TPA: AI-2E family transporter [Patescibacteria group bacterium]|jgi:predicted PurR-regulated permease PerM|nr:AI-2E family transporter [Patescibacteria group bacterium]
MATSKSQRIQTISFLVLLLIVFILVLFIFRPFVNIIALAVILTILFRPVYNWLLSKVHRPGVASILTVLLILLIIAVPIWFFGQVLFNEIVNLYNRYRSGAFVIDRSQIISTLPTQLQTAVQSLSSDINSFIGRLSSEAFASFSSILSNIAGFILATFMLFFMVYYLLRDGRKIKEVLKDISPISSVNENKLIDRIIAAVNGVVKGSFLIAISQGIVATVGFLIFGVPEAFLWGLFTVVAALVPTVGTSLAVIPAVIYLFITGHTPQAIGLLIWGAAAVGLVDNFLGPKLVSRATKLHPVLVLLAVIGGLKFFGVLGFLIGPILLAIFVALIDMYRNDFKEYLA